MAADHGQPDHQASRLKALYDRLAAILRARGPERAEAFKELLDDEQEHEDADADRGPEGGRRE
jgi:hypothetical protein